jgi:hypothetical protein
MGIFPTIRLAFTFGAEIDPELAQEMRPANSTRTAVDTAAVNTATCFAFLVKHIKTPLRKDHFFPHVVILLFRDSGF